MTTFCTVFRLCVNLNIFKIGFGGKIKTFKSFGVHLTSLHLEGKHLELHYDISCVLFARAYELHQYAKME